MSEETITVADVSAGPGGTETIEAGTPVELPVVDILTGRGFVTGKSGSGKSNTVSVMLENLLDNNFPVLVVDSDGEYYGLKEAYEVLHVGADDECDIQVTADHAEKIASLALEENIPIILDVSGYLDDDDADELVLETTRHLFAKEKKLKKPFLVVVEECHEYIPEKSGMGEAGKMLIKIGKRGRKHGLGIVGISQRPADVKKDFITQCDWLVWHRLTWRNDTKVVGRILGSEYADAVEELADGEGFLVADWASDIQRVQFHRKRTFDAGATPGLEDFERPELKSVSGDLVSELTEISDEKERRESKIADLQKELEKKEAKIKRLEDELEEARDLSRMADKFAQALLDRSEAPYRGGSDPNRPTEQTHVDEYHPEEAARPRDDSEPAFDPLIAEAEPDRTDSQPEPAGAATETSTTTEPAAPGDSRAEAEPATDTDDGQRNPLDPFANDAGSHPSEDLFSTSSATTSDETADSQPSTDGLDDQPAAASTASSGESATDTTATSESTTQRADASENRTKIPTDPVEALGGSAFDTPAEMSAFEALNEEMTPPDTEPVDPSEVSEPTPAERAAADQPTEFATVSRKEIAEEAMQFAEAVELGTRDAVVEELRERVEELPEISVEMLKHYHDEGTSDPLTAHSAAGGDDNQQLAYSRNRPLRQAQLVRHIGRGRYTYAVPELIQEAYAHQLEGDQVDEMVEAVEAVFREAVDDPKIEGSIDGSTFGFDRTK